MSDATMTNFATESEFENALIHELRQRGWGDAEVIKNPTEADLLANWKQILFENNRGKDRLNEVPLTDSEMQQIMEQITAHRTPLKLNGFINGKTVAITRDNPDDTLHFGKEVSLKIYDRHEIAAGQSRYQIVQQPRYARGSPILNERRGDILLLINGMPSSPFSMVTLPVTSKVTDPERGEIIRKVMNRRFGQGVGEPQPTAALATPPRHIHTIAL